MKALRIGRSGCSRVLAVLLVALGCAGTALSEELVFANDAAPYCPFSLCSPDKDGYVLDIVNTIYRARGYGVTIKNVPWNRALSMVRSGEADGVLGVFKKSAPELLYPATEVEQVNPVVLALKENPWRFDGVESFKSVRIGLIQGYGYGDLPALAHYLNTHPSNVEWIAAESPLLRIFKMMQSGRVDVTMEDISVAKFVLAQSGMADQFRVAGTIGKNGVKGYVAFSPRKSHSKKLARIFDQGMLELRKSGQLKTILAAYGVSDWRQSLPADMQLPQWVAKVNAP